MDLPARRSDVARTTAHNGVRAATGDAGKEEGRPLEGSTERPTDRSFDPRDVEIERLKKERDGLRSRERMARSELEELHKRFTLLSQSSKRFATSMRSQTGERQRYRRRLAAQYAVSRVLERRRDLSEAAPEILRIMCEQLGWEVGVLWSREGGVLRCEALWQLRERPSAFEEACRRASFARGEGLPGRVWARGEPVRAEDTLDEGGPLVQIAAKEGLRGAIAFPVRDGGLVGVFMFLRREALTPDEDLLRTAALVGRQVGQFVERRRAEAERDRSLYREREARRELSGILESISDAFFAVDGQWRLTYVNRRAEDLWSRSRDELLGKNFREVFPGVAGSEQYREIRRAMEKRTTASFETISPFTGGWVAGRVYPSANGGVAVYFDDITEQKEAEEERERLLARELAARAQAEERRRLSRELHDRVAHDIALVHQSLELHEALKVSDPERASTKMELARRILKEALESTRDLSMELRQPDVRRGLEAALANLLHDFVPPTFESSLSVQGDEALMPPEIRNQVFLILREAIRNAVTHSGAGRIAVELDVGRDEVVGRVEDDGCGFEPDGVRTARSGGLRAMEERATLIGATLDLSSAPGKGTAIAVSVPLEVA